MKKSSLKLNTVLNIIKTMSSILFPLITFPYVSRILLPENIGKINFAQSYVSYFSLIAGLGISTYAIRECALAKSDRDKLNQISSELFSINLITTVIAYFLLICSFFLFKKVRTYELLILIESVTILATTVGADWLNSAMEDYKFITLRTIFFQFVSLILIFVYVRNSEDFYKYLIITSMATCGLNLVNASYRKKYCNIRFTLGIDWKKHISSILLLFVMNLSVTIFSNADITMLGVLQNDYQVGLYSTALKINKIITQVVQSLALVIIPRLTIMFAEYRFEEANKLLRKVLGFNITLGLPCAIGTIALSEDIIMLVGGLEYEGAVSILKILMISFMFTLIGGSFLGNAILIPLKQEKYYMIVCCITAFVNILLNAVMIPLFNANGAAIATAFNGFIIMILLLIKTDKRVHIVKLKRIFSGPVIGSVFIILICFLFNKVDNYIIRVGLSVGTSTIVYLFIQIIFKNDIVLDFINTLSRKILKKDIIGG